jgi:phosphoadenosine phosphosulfate reductase
MQKVRLDAAALSSQATAMLPDGWLEDLPPQRVVAWAVEAFAPKLVMTSAFGLHGVALIHMLQTISREPPILFVDTGYLFDETLQTRQRVIDAYGVPVLTLHADGDEGTLPGYDDPDRCCLARKVGPMRQALARLQPAAVLNARTRFQARSRRTLPVIEWDANPIRINPLAGWTLPRVRDYVSAHGVPYNPLHDAGYPSIGCWPCTRPVRAGESVRAGRWPGVDKAECGLWARTGSGGCGVWVRGAQTVGAMP